MSILGQHVSDLPPPTALDYTQNWGPDLIAANLCGAILATISVCLRLLARAVTGARFGMDDLLILVALVIGWGLAVTTIEMVKNGMGRHLNILTPDQVVACSKGYYALELEWTFAILSVKLSILFFYHRLFGQLRYFHWTSIAIGCFTIAWALTTMFVVIFQCHPISFLWNRDQPGWCLQAWTAWVVVSTVDVAVDLIIFFLPVHAAWHIHVSTKQRLLLVLTFAVGSTAWIFGVVRLAAICTTFVNQNPDWTWSTSPTVMWSTLEPTLGITAISLAATKPLQKFVFEKYRSMRGRPTRVPVVTDRDMARTEPTYPVNTTCPLEATATQQFPPSHSLTASSMTRTGSFENGNEKSDDSDVFPEEFPQYQGRAGS